MKHIYIVRHAQTEFNKNGIVQGSGVDSDINEYGRGQASQLFNFYKNISFDCVYTSALKRTTQTMEGFIGKGIKHIVCPELNEIGWGNREGQPITPEENQYYHSMIYEWQKGNTAAKIEGGESPEQVAERMRKFQIMLENDNNTNVMICMHGRAMRILLCVLLNYNLKYMDGFPHQNSCVYQLLFDGKTYRVYKSNNTDHLS